LDHDFDFWDEDILDDLDPQAIRKTITYSRAWTVETILNQIEAGSIDLSPSFQRRNAWTDEKRSRLIESLLLNVPVPEVILAERVPNSRRYMVLDGKQRLQAVLGFVKPSSDLWVKAQLKSLKVESSLNGLTWDEISTDPKYSDVKRRFENSDIRCTIISNVHDDDILYDIFFRLNSGSVPLSSQELRHSIYHGKYADFISDYTLEDNKLRKILRIDGPDKRLRDAELLHRLILMFMFPNEYKGNLKKFLDYGMGRLNKDWIQVGEEVEQVAFNINESIEKLLKVLGDKKIGRKFVKNKWEGRFNKVLFEAELYYFQFVPLKSTNRSANDKFIAGLESLMSSNIEFVNSIESTTKTVDRYKIRFEEVRLLVQSSYNITNLVNPFQ
jgi:hypothetical protein